MIWHKSKLVMAKQIVELPFIVSTDVKRPDKETQRFIRSHVMKGKNKGKLHHTKGKGTGSSTHARTTDDATETPKQGPSIWDYRPLGFIRTRVGSELAFVPFADEIDLSLAAPVIKCKLIALLQPSFACCFRTRSKLINAIQVTSISKAALFPLESCMELIEPPQASWVATLCTDAVYLNATIFAVQVYFDLLAGRELEPVSPLTPTYTPFSKTLRLLRERLGSEDEKLKLSDNTVMVVLILACHAHRLGQYSTARNHLVGLRRIIEMRGGIKDLKTRPKLLIETFR